MFALRFTQLTKCAVVVASLLVGGAESLSAQDIRWKPETLTKGDYVILNQGNDEQAKHVFRGKFGRGYLLESYFASQPKGQRPYKTVLDKNGNYLQWIQPDGDTTKFRPHDCKRTLGRCKFSIHYPDGRRETRTRIVELAKGGFLFKMYDAKGAFMRSGYAELDERGFAGDGWSKTPKGTRKYRLVSYLYQ